MLLSELVSYLEQLLETQSFNDYCPNGLQVEGVQEITKIITGVTASHALLVRAIQEKAQAILVHHGYFWKGEYPALTGMKRQRIKLLMMSDINLLAYHLPLDVHPVYGNNIQLAHHLDISFLTAVTVNNIRNLISVGELNKPMQADEFKYYLKTKLGREPFYWGRGEKFIKRIAWCTGAGQDYIQKALELNCDAFLTGEVSERTVYIAEEENIHFFSAGHHATERYGIKALGEHLANIFKLEHQFIDIDNPI